MEVDKDKQAPMFTVRNAEGAMVAFAIFAIASLATVCLHEILLKNKGFLEALYTIADNFPKIMSAATTLTFIEEGLDVMFQRLRDSLKREQKIRVKREKEIRAESEARGEAKVYQEVAAWNARRMEAEARGEKFTEPPPAPPQGTSK